LIEKHHILGTKFEVYCRYLTPNIESSGVESTNVESIKTNGVDIKNTEIRTPKYEY